ncbi:tyrosine-type recombinase/integrase [Arthrobacter sp. D1-29]
MRSGAVYNRAWRPAWENTGVPKDRWARIHDLRHTNASWMIAGGMDLFQLSHRLGHQSTATTDGRYAHLMPSLRTAGAKLATAALAR